MDTIRLMTDPELDETGHRGCHALIGGVPCTAPRRPYKRTCEAHRAVFGVSDMLGGAVAYRAERLRNEAAPRRGKVRGRCRVCGADAALNSKGEAAAHADAREPGPKREHGRLLNPCPGGGARPAFQPGDPVTTHDPEGDHGLVETVDPQTGAVTVRCVTWSGGPRSGGWHLRTYPAAALRRLERDAPADRPYIDSIKEGLSGVPSTGMRQ